jgi:hypothetical protein
MRKEDQDFKDNLNYIVTLRPAWAYVVRPCLKNKQQKLISVSHCSLLAYSSTINYLTTLLNLLINFLLLILKDFLNIGFYLQLKILLLSSLNDFSSFFLPNCSG